MKIGILTFHCAHNYGAVLQAYGLQEYLKSCGHEVEIIDYRPKYLTRPYGVFPIPNLKRGTIFRRILRLGAWFFRFPKHVMAMSIRRNRRKGFEKFISEKLNLSREQFMENSRVPTENYDAIVFGSDQIWSPNHTEGGDPIFLGDFLTPAGTLKIAYAASAGASSETLGENSVFANTLKNFDAISVREDNLGNSLQPHTDLKIKTVLDPTLLADKSVWEKLAVPPKTSKKYVLVYQVSYNPEADRVAKELSEQLDAEVVSIWAGYGLPSSCNENMESPEQFVGWFKNAACVVSTSFHGTAFGLIFEKPLYYVGNGNAAENRPKQILNALGLSERYIAGTSSTPKFSEIDYSLLRNKKLLETLQGHSREFLKKSLKITHE